MSLTKLMAVKRFPRWLPAAAAHRSALYVICMYAPPFPTALKRSSSHHNKADTVVRSDIVPYTAKSRSISLSRPWCNTFGSTREQFSLDIYPPIPTKQISFSLKTHNPPPSPTFNLSGVSGCFPRAPTRVSYLTSQKDTCL